MLEEAVEVMRKLWQGGFVTHHGKHYTVEHARIYTLPDTPPPIYVSGFGPKAVDLAARIGDGYVSTMPDGDLVKRFRDNGGGDKPCQAGFKAAFAATEDEGAEIAYEKWPNAGVPGELSQVLPSPRHFEQAAQNVTKEQVKSAFVCGNDPDGPPGDDRPVRQGRVRRGLRRQHRAALPGPVRPVRQARSCPGCADRAPRKPTCSASVSASIGRGTSGPR